MKQAKLIMILFLMSLTVVVTPVQRVDATGFPTVDIANLVEQVMQIVNQVEQITQAVNQVENQFTQITNQVQQIDNQLQSLERLSNGDWGAFNNLLGMIEADIDAIVNGTNGGGITYNPSSVRGEWEALYTVPQNMTVSELSDYLGRMDQQLKDTSQTAAYSQTALERIKSNSNQAQAILANSEGADGEVRQLQSLNQLVALTQGQLGDLTAMTATTGRVIAEQASREAMEREISRDASNRLLENYTYKGAPSIKLNRLP